MIGTGEHGIGIGKKEYLVDELGEGTVELMRTIKRVVDPLNLLNPGKVWLSLRLSGVGNNDDANLSCTPRQANHPIHLGITPKCCGTYFSREQYYILSSPGLTD